jgi:hypothetical protein
MEQQQTFFAGGVFAGCTFGMPMLTGIYLASRAENSTTVVPYYSTRRAFLCSGFANNFTLVNKLFKNVLNQ